MKLLFVTTCVLLFVLVVAEDKRRGTPLISLLRKVYCHVVQLIGIMLQLLTSDETKPGDRKS